MSVYIIQLMSAPDGSHGGTGEPHYDGYARRGQDLGEFVRDSRRCRDPLGSLNEAGYITHTRAVALACIVCIELLIRGVRFLTAIYLL